MAKKTKQAVATEATEPLDLDKTILVDGMPYNVNAVTADKVANALTINPNLGESCQFDGHESATINVMSPSGGAFTGPITVPSHTSESESEYKFADTDVLNFTEIVNVLLDNIKNNAVVYNWENDEENKELKPSLADNAINSISIVSGGELAVDSFHTFNNESYQKHLNYLRYLEASATDDTLEEVEDAFYLPVYLYIGTGYNLVYCGIAGTEKAKLLNINATKVVEQAEQLTTATQITVDLGIEAKDGETFNGSDDVVIGVTGELPITKVKIDEDTAEDARSRLGITPKNIGAATTSHTHSASDITSGTLSPASGGTGQTKLDDVTVGNALKLGNQKSDFYQKKITISTNIPTDQEGVNGDIWIVYK